MGIVVILVIKSEFDPLPWACHRGTRRPGCRDVEKWIWLDVRDDVVQFADATPGDEKLAVCEGGPGKESVLSVRS